MEFFKRHILWLSFGALIIIVVGGYTFAFAPPSDFPQGKTVVIARGASVSDIANELFDAHVIKHSTALWFTLRVSGTSDRVQAGTYLFATKENVFTIAHRLTTGASGLPLVRVTFPEGMTVRDIGTEIHTALPQISVQDFVSAGKSSEGYLFPDTYLFLPDTSITVIIETMRKTFDIKIQALSSDIAASGHSLADVMTMASLVEKEARTDLNRRIVAGILWDRLALSMPLQVDAVFGYIFDRDTYSPSFADLKVDSPYNTYTHKGLPPGPICNPGLASIDAAIHPTKTKYLYYLTDKDGVMHYATTYVAHQANQQKYLH
jgi:UPF0755 protein